MVLKHENLFHVGVVVEDLDQGMAEFRESLGVSWRQPFFPSADVKTPHGRSTMKVGAVYTEHGPVHYELLQRIDSGLWQTCGLHHLGYWSNDVAGDTERLVKLGYVLEGMMMREDEVIGAYLLLNGSSRIELTPRSSSQRLLGK
ncbi:VOC family protein [Rhodococcus sp. NPDC059968]|uniref:VOC family protein n=1 Tax=Rhodococcus sp. NPDC059968 TaxID=3347017 RepID=UPI003672B8D0